MIKYFLAVNKMYTMLQHSVQIFAQPKLLGNILFIFVI